MTKGDHFEWVGRTIDAKYRVDEVVDASALGVIYRAHHLGFDETVALKCLKVPSGLEGPARDAFCQRFVAEGRFLHRLSRSSAGIVQALDVGAEPGPDGAPVPYLVLEWLEGTSLADDLEARARAGAGGRSLEAAIALLEPAVRALSSAHEQGVAHCDVKPTNLFLTTIAGHPTIKVLDFGIAKVFTLGASLEPAQLEELETSRDFSAPYAAPEQFMRRYGGVGPRTDVFALALVLVELVSGQKALQGGELGELLRASADPLHRPTLRARGVDCSAEVDEVMRRALAVEPSERFDTALAFWQALGEAARDSAPSLASSGRLPRGHSRPSSPSEPSLASSGRLPRGHSRASQPSPSSSARFARGSSRPSQPSYTSYALPEEVEPLSAEPRPSFATEDRRRALRSSAKGWSASPDAPAERAAPGEPPGVALISLVILAASASIMLALALAWSQPGPLLTRGSTAPAAALPRLGAPPPAPGPADRSWPRGSASTHEPAPLASP